MHPLVTLQGKEMLPYLSQEAIGEQLLSKMTAYDLELLLS